MRKREERHIGQVQARHLQRTAARRRALRVKTALERLPQGSMRTQHKTYLREQTLKQLAKEREAREALQAKAHRMQ